MKRFTITLPDDLHEWLTNESKERGIPMNAVSILALESYKNSKLRVLPAEVFLEIINRLNDSRSSDLDD